MGFHEHQIIKPPEKPAFPPYVYYPQLISPPECEELIKIGESKTHVPGGVGNAGNDTFVTDEDYRKVDTCSLFPQDADWLFKRLKEHIDWTNRDHFRFDLSGMFEAAIWLKYTKGNKVLGEKDGHYKWHQDFGGGYSSLRKLSVMVQLSKPQCYKGCRLRLFTNGDFNPGHIEQGDVVIFPSWLPHMVTPIREGTRYALAIWVSGPQFR